MRPIRQPLQALGLTPGPTRHAGSDATPRSSTPPPCDSSGARLLEVKMLGHPWRRYGTAMTLMDEHGAAKATGASGGLNSYPVLKTGPLSRRHRTGQYFLPTLGITFNKGVSHCRLRTRLKTTRPYGCCGRNSKVPPIHGRPAHPR